MERKKKGGWVGGESLRQRGERAEQGVKEAPEGVDSKAFQSELWSRRKLVVQGVNSLTPKKIVWKTGGRAYGTGWRGWGSERASGEISNALRQTTAALRQLEGRRKKKTISYLANRGEGGREAARGTNPARVKLGSKPRNAGLSYVSFRRCYPGVEEMKEEGGVYTAEKKGRHKTRRLQSVGSRMARMHDERRGQP